MPLVAIMKFTTVQPAMNTLCMLMLPHMLTLYNFCRNNQQDLGNILGALYLAMLFLGIINSMTVQPVAFTERGVMYRERASGMYHELPFALAQCAVELPYNLLQTLLFGAISYYMMGFAGTAAKFFW